MLTIDVYADIACPWCRIGRHRLRQAVAALTGELEVRVRHRPYQLDPDEPFTPVPLPKMMIRKYGEERVAFMFAEMRSLGQAEGLVFELEKGQAVNTFDAHRLLWFADHAGEGDAQQDLATALYDAYFRDGENVADHELLARLAGKAGIEEAAAREFLRSDEGVAEVKDLIVAARAEGVRSVPTTVFPDGTRVSGAKEIAFYVEALRRAASAQTVSGAEGDSCAI